MNITHYSIRQSVIMTITTSDRLSVTGKMFRTGKHVFTLKTFNPCDTYTTNEIRIFTISFLDTSPTGITRHIQHRRNPQICSFGLNCRSFTDFLYQFCIKRTTHINPVREYSRTGSIRLAVQPFGFQHCRNLQPSNAL